MFVDEIDLDVQLAGGNEVLYVTYKKKFAVFLRKEEEFIDFCLKAEWLSDENVAKFLISLGNTTNYRPHHKKSALAALNDSNRLLGLSNIFDFKHLWPKTHLAIRSWDQKLKQSPYFPLQASHFSREAMLVMCDLVCENTQDLSDLVAVITCCWTSFRAEDLHSLLSKHVTKVRATEKNPRMWKLYLESMKNDPLGQGPAQDREFVIPCICQEGLKTASQVKAFKRDLTRNENFECIGPCPYQKIKDYMDVIPDPFGQIAESSSRKGDPLHFMRGRNTTGMRRFLHTTLGKLK
jgi:hypothetical protein